MSKKISIKKFISIFLTLAMVIALVPLSSMTVRADPTDNSNFDYGDCHYLVSGDTLTISGTGTISGYAFSTVNSGWTKLVICDEVAGISGYGTLGSHASTVTSITFQGNCTIDENVFTGVGSSGSASNPTIVFPAGWTGTVPTDNTTAWYGGYFTPSTYSITYATNGGTSIASASSQTNLPSTLPTTTYANHIFYKWYTNSSYTTEAVAGALLTADTTLYAKWFNWTECTAAISSASFDSGTSLDIAKEIAEANLSAADDGTCVAYIDVMNNYFCCEKVSGSWSGNNSYSVSELNSRINSGKKVYVLGTTSPYVSTTGVSLNKATTSLYTNDTEKLIATVTPSNATTKTVTWSSDKESVATVDSNGVVKGVSKGTAVITATTTDGSFTATCTVTVNGLSPTKYTPTWNGTTISGTTAQTASEMIDSLVNTPSSYYQLYEYCSNEAKTVSGFTQTDAKAIYDELTGSGYQYVYVSYGTYNEGDEYTEIEIYSASDTLKAAIDKTGSTEVYVTKEDLTGSFSYALSSSQDSYTEVTGDLTAGTTYYIYWKYSESTTSTDWTLLKSADNTAASVTVSAVVYTLTFDANGNGTAPDAQNITSGSKATKPEDPSAEGYTFSGWYKENTCTNSWNFDSDTVTANTTLYAKWTENHTHAFATTWSSDSSYHWHDATCGDTTDVSDKAEHSFGTYTSNNDATTEKDGTKTRTCSVCGYKDTVTDTGSKIIPSEGSVKVSEEKQDGNFASAGLANTAAEVKTTVLTEDDMSEISAGKDVNVWLEVKDQTSTVASTDKKIINDVIPDDYNVGNYLELTLWKQVSGSEATKVTETPKGKVKIVITVPKEMQKSGRIYKIIRVHNGTATLIDAILGANYELTFETNQFSTYAIIYEESTADVDDSTVENKVTDNDNSNDADKSSDNKVQDVSTGSINNLYVFLIVLIACCIAMAASVVITRKKENI